MSTPLVVICAAMAVPSGYYRPLERSFAGQGWPACTVPTRGFEPGQPRASRHHDWSYGSEVDEIARVVAAARADEPDRPVLLVGHSLGAQLGAMHELHRAPSDGFVAIGAGVPHFRAYPHGGLPVLFMGVSVPVVTRALGFVPRPFFGGPGAATLMRQWARFIRTGRPPFEVPHPVAAPTLVITLQADALAVRAATDAYVDLFLDAGRTTRWTYRASDTPPGGTTDHVGWVRHPEVVVDQITSWWEGRT